MKRSALASTLKAVPFCAAVAAASLASASDVALQKAPPLTVEQVSSYPENVARFHFGAEVKSLAPAQAPAARLDISTNGDTSSASQAALLCDDPTIGYQLPQGQSSILVSLANIENIQSISFANDGTKGSVAVAISNADVPPNSPEWHDLGKNAMQEGAITAKVGPTEAKYVRLTFDVTAPGRIANFGVYATPAVSDFTMPRPRKVSFENSTDTFALLNYNYTDLHVRARGLYASSGDVAQVNKMIDDQPATAYVFAAGDNAPTAVIDLGHERSLSRIAATFATQPGSVDFYVFDSLAWAQANDAAADSGKPEIQKISNTLQMADLPASLTIKEKSLQGMKPVGSVVTTSQGRAAVDFPATTGRYIMLRWHPASTQGEPFSVAQVAAFGRHLPGAQGPGNEETTDENADVDGKDGKDIADAKSIYDNKNIPAEGGGENEAAPPAEGPPPALPNVPPFTFIPQVAPTSP